MPIVSTYAGYPIYSLSIASPPSSNESRSKSDSNDAKDTAKDSSHEEGGEIVLSGGGGGPGRSGVKNKITIFSASPNWDSLTIHSDYEFSKNEDSAMSVAIHPKEKVVFASVNPAQANTKQSKEDKEKEKDSKTDATGNCRLFKWEDKAKSLSSLSSNVSTVEKNSMEEYQRVSAFSPDGKYLACGTTAGKVYSHSFLLCVDSVLPSPYSNFLLPNHTFFRNF
ncbi:hypothetical protein BKA69DRAFT_1067881 [Paraphysoderma sedebokerense]|nr:hypothetical protein BKA69DRAFT_1067881 [Paraphysoderma sedebokerense]